MSAKRTPRPLWVAAGAMVSLAGAALLLDPRALPKVAGLLGVVLLAYFLLRGSRIAWLVSLFSALSQVLAPVAMDQTVWIAGLGMVVLCGLLMRTSRAFVWSDRRGQRAAHSPLITGRVQRRDASMVYRVMIRYHGLREYMTDMMRVVNELNRRKLLLSMIVAVVILYPLIGMLYKVHHGAASGDLVVDAVWAVVWVSFTFLRLALIVLLVIAAYHYASTRWLGASRA